MKIKIYKCNRCKHEWAARKKCYFTKPRMCPKCKNTYWDKPRKRKVKIKNIVDNLLQ